MINLKLATLQDTQLIAELAQEIWYECYPEIISKNQIDYMLEKYYRKNALENQMSEGQQFYLISTEKEENVGYLAVTEMETDKWFMNKFYIRAIKRMCGIGSIALKLWEQIAHPTKLSLQVNRRNFKSVNFYFKSGFKIEKVADFDIGEGYSMDDFIMVKKYA